MNENINKNVLFDSIFIETHSELTTLNDEFNKLYKHYNTTEDSDELVNEEEFFIESQASNNSAVEYVDSFESDCFTQQEIALFQQIYQTNLIQNFNEYEEKKNNKMSEQDNQAFLAKIRQTDCCPKKCFNTSIDHDEALKRFCKIKLMSAAEKNIGRVSNHAIKLETVLHILTFIRNFAAQHGLPSPGRHFREETRSIVYLPACESYYSLFRLYNDTIDINDENNYVVSQSSFSRIWKRYLPGIKFLTARSDLCMQCKEMRFSAKRWAPYETLNKINEWSNHYSWASLEREYYR
ncbi:1533_t:CDS:2 [Gigaspora margarita]|uniref:1533_t:CDS:1 n=1 Tax=Gigaspora margarita TaxID=4874 RepID=A0ABM8VXJ2_GIGMA|nr:1533_t:CDS:2 [Gigaspora margarita]